MKRKLLILPILLLGLVSCSGNSGGTPGGGGGQDGSQEGGKGEGDSGSRDSGGGGGREDANKSQLMLHIEELGDNVDKTPTLLDEIAPKQEGGDKDGPSTKKAVDVTGGNDGIATLNNYDPWGYNLLKLQWANGKIAEMKSKKDTVINNVIMLDKWVAIHIEDNWEEYNRLRYDDTTDTAFFETLNNTQNGLSYERIESTYNEKGKTSIRDYVYGKSSYNGTISREYAFFEEDEYLILVNYTSEHDYVYIYADLREGHEVTNGLEAVLLDHGTGSYSFEVKKMIYRPERDYQDEYLAFNTYNATELIEGYKNNPTPDMPNYEMLLDNLLRREISQRSDFAYIYDENHEGCAMIQNNEGSVSIGIDPWQLNGYEQIIYNDDGTYTIKLNHGETLTAVTGGDVEDLRNPLNNNMYLFFSAHPTAHTLDAHFSFQISDVATAVADIESFTGLTFKSQNAIDVINDIPNMHDKLSNHTFFGISVDTYLYPTEIMAIKDRYAKYFDQTDEEDIASFNLPATAVDKNAQTSDDNYYSLFTKSCTGNITIDVENRKVNLGDVKLILNETAVLNDGAEYKLVATIIDEAGSSTPIKEKAFNYQRGTSEIPFDNEQVDITLDNDGVYKIGVYLTYNAKRVSKVYYPLVTGEAYFEDLGSKYIRFKADESSYRLAVASSPVESALIMLREFNNEFDLSGVHVNMLNDVFFEGDEVELVFELQDETRLCSMSTLIGNGDATLVGNKININNDLDLEEGSYFVRAYFTINDTTKIDIPSFTGTGDNFEFNNGSKTIAVSFNEATHRLELNVTVND